MDDWELLRRYLAGDRAAMERLVVRHIDMVYATARRASHGSAADAEDITQAVFLLLTRKAARIVRRGTLVGWLYRATRWCAANFDRQERRRRRLVQEAAMQARDSAASASARHTDMLDMAALALARLKEEERAAVLLRCISQKSYADAGEALGITPEAARKRAQRGLEKLRDYLAAHGHAGASVLVLADTLSTTAVKAPPAVVASTLHIAAGGPAAPHVAGLLQQSRWLPAKVAAACVVAVTVMAGIPFLHRAPSAKPAALVGASLVAAPAPALPPLELLAADPAHPTAAEVKTFLKARLERLSNLMVDYDVHTAYVAPPNGWPTPPARPADASAPEALMIAPAPIIALSSMFEPNTSLLTLFPSGTVDATKTFSRLPGYLRYDRKITHLQRVVAFPDSLRQFTEQTYTFHDDMVDRLLVDQDGEAAAVRSNEAALPEPDIETALFLTTYLYPPMGLSPAGSHPAQRLLTSADIDAMSVTFPDAHHILVFRDLPASRLGKAREEWTLDRDARCAPCAYRNPSSVCPVEMVMSDFHDAAGLSVPRKIVIRFSIEAPKIPVLWRQDTLTINDCRIQDAANAPARYVMQWPDDMPPAATTRNHAATQRFAPPLKTMELFIGAESFAIDPVTRLNRAYAETARNESPSKSAYRDAPAFRAAHEAFLKRVRQGGIDVLFLGGSVIQHWADDPALSKIVTDPKRTANFGIAGDLLEHVLWRVTHGELDGLSPKVIILLAGELDALYATSPESPARGAQIMGANYGVFIQWRPPRHSPADIAAGIVHLARTVHEKCPQAQLVVLAIPPRPIRIGASASAHDAIARINDRITEINQAAAAIEDHTSIHFLDPGKLALTPEGEPDPTLFQTNSLPTPALYTRWDTLIAPYLTTPHNP